MLVYKMLAILLIASIVFLVTDIYASNITAYIPRIGGVRIEVVHGPLVFEHVELSASGDLGSRYFDTIEFSVYVKSPEDEGQYVVYLYVFNGDETYYGELEITVTTTPTTYVGRLPSLVPQQGDVYVLLKAKKID